MCDQSPPDNRERVRKKMGVGTRLTGAVALFRFSCFYPILQPLSSCCYMSLGWCSSRATLAVRQQPWQQEPQYGNYNNLSERLRSLITRQLCPRSTKKEKKRKEEEKKQAQLSCFSSTLASSLLSINLSALFVHSSGSHDWS